MNRKKVYVVQGWDGMMAFLSPDKFERVNNIESCDMVIFPGGEDVHPSLYGEKAHEETAPKLARDLYELNLYKKAVRLNKFILGICRGSQLICALQHKGRLVQHQQNRLQHSMQTFDNKILTVNSTHHQAQFPFEMDKSDYKLLGWSENVSSYHRDGNNKELAPERECEIVYYPKAKALGIQYHPEDLDYGCQTNVWTRNLVDRFLNEEL